MPIAPVAPAGVAPPVAPAASPKPSFASALAQRAPPAPTAAAGPPSPSPNRALAALEGIERAQRRLDAVLEAARAGRTFTAQELIGLQAEAYRAAQTVDLGAKLVEQGAQSVKSALTAQV
jgi:hypothetical protein